MNFQKNCKDSREHSSSPGSQCRPQGASYILLPHLFVKRATWGLLTMLYALCSAQRCCSNVLSLPQDPVQVTTLTGSGHASLTSSVTTSQPSLVFDECDSFREVRILENPPPLRSVLGFSHCRADGGVRRETARGGAILVTSFQGCTRPPQLSPELVACSLCPFPSHCLPSTQPALQAGGGGVGESISLNYLWTSAMREICLSLHLLLQPFTCMSRESLTFIFYFGLDSNSTIFILWPKCSKFGHW